MDLKEKLKEELADEFLKICNIMGRNNYTNLSSNATRTEIKAYLLKYFRNSPYNQEKVSKLVEDYDKIIFDFLDGEMTKGQRPIKFMDFYEDKLRKMLMDSNTPRLSA